MSNKIIMLLSNAFDSDPRVRNEAKVLFDNHYRVIILAWDRQGKYPEFEKIDGIEVKRIKIKSTYGKGLQQLFSFIFFQARAFFYLIQADFDIVHCHDFDTLIPGVLAGKIKGKKIIYDAHEDYPAMMRDRGLTLLSFIFENVQRIFSKFANGIIAATPHIKNQFLERRNVRVTFIPNTKKSSEYNYNLREIRHLKRNLSLEEKFVFLYIGTLSKDRNIKLLIKIFKEIKNNSIFVICGRGILEKEVDQLSKGEKNVRFLGLISLDKVSLYTKMADVIVAIYSAKKINNRMGLPNKLFEAIAAGKPIIASNEGPTGEIIKDTGCGIAVNPDDEFEIKNAIEKIAKNRKFYNEIKQNSKVAQKRYDWEDTSEKLIEFYLTIAE